MRINNNLIMRVGSPVLSFVNRMQLRNGSRSWISSSCSRLGASLLALLLWCVSSSVAAHQSTNQIEGHWEGTITREGKTWRVNLDAGARPEGGPLALIDLVDFAVYSVPFTLTEDSSSVRLERKQPTGAPITFIGSIKTDAFSGEFTGLGVTAPFAVRRIGKTPDFFKEEEVTFRNGEVTLAGTIIIPKGRGPYPAIVLTHGGGPDGREKPGYKTDGYFLARLGVAALVYDKRGVGKSTGDYQTASLEDLADD